MKSRIGRYDPRDLVTIAGDGMIAHRRESEGRMVPLAILDTVDRPDLAELIRVHRHLDSGDHSIIWGEIERAIALHVEFIRPIPARMIVLFDVSTHGILVDCALRVGAIGIQAGRPGDRLISTYDSPRIILEVPNTGFETIWNGIYEKRIAEEVERRSSLKGQDSLEAAREVIARMRGVADFRFVE